jgi:hypothetical protein
MPDPAKEPACALQRCRGTSSGRLFSGCRRPPGNQKSAGIRKETAGTPRRTGGEILQSLREITSAVCQLTVK